MGAAQAVAKVPEVPAPLGLDFPGSPHAKAVKGRTSAFYHILSLEAFEAISGLHRQIYYFCLLTQI